MQLESALYMIPVPISDGKLSDFLPSGNSEIISGIRHFIVENVRTARRFLKKMDPSTDISQLTFYELNGHTPEDDISGYLTPLREGNPMGVMSEAGCPGVADPGAKVVLAAQNEGLRIIPLVGPSSILLSLMASGLNGQKFAFQGYLPVDTKERDKTIRDLESQSRRLDMTQIFIETPYRNEKMLDSLLKNLGGETLLCVASDVTNPQEKIITKPVKRWKEDRLKIEKVPTIFLFYCRDGKK
ncbi:MAG: SAM-dependent methyltransferase [Muribaculaceae bacterium]|nr:SAM-dependent methyltransferase [Muribaculaceae bacterium]